MTYESWAKTVCSQFKVGDRVVVCDTVERYPHFTIQAGSTGTVTMVPESDLSSICDTLAIKMDSYIEGCEMWSNELCYSAEDEDRVFTDLLVLLPPRPRTHIPRSGTPIDNTMPLSADEMFTVHQSPEEDLEDMDRLIGKSRKGSCLADVIIFCCILVVGWIWFSWLRNIL